MPQIKYINIKQVIKAIKKLICSVRGGRYYDIIYSIGEDCACAAWLQSYNIRLTSGPFDWLCKAKLDVRFEYLLNRFQGFLNSPNDLQREFNPTNDNNETYQHFIYNNVKDGFAFLHDFEKQYDNDFKKSFNMVRKRIQRRIDRFYKNISDNEKILLVYLDIQNRYKDSNVDGDILKKYCENFCKSVKKEIDFLFIFHSDTITKSEKIANNVTKITCYTKNSKDAEPGWYQGNKTTIPKIFEKLKLKK
jgi:hypothetical protein